MASYKNLDVSDIGSDATARDLEIFQAICAEAVEIHGGMNEADVLAKVWGDGDYLRNARNMGVDVDAIFASIPE